LNSIKEIKMVNARTTPERGYYKRAVGVFNRQEDVEAVLSDLKKSAYDMDRVSLIARHIDGVKGAEEVTEQHGNEAKEGAGIGATTGTVLGGLGGFLIGVGLLAIPGVGPILAAGAEISAIASTLAGAGIGAAAGGIIGALVGLGIPEERAKVYNQRIEAGDYLVMVSGTEDDLSRSQSIMRNHNVQEFGMYDAPDLVGAKPAPAAPVAEPVVEREEVVTKTRDIDIDRDNEPEVLIVDKRDEIR
jgi:hypothetical protein